ncbi:hypothetical protein [Vulcanococcus limneticus]|uniref:hypothetical protein n=1 Tax=Vulcanococcus limneticus TaxID=2170428 RepID=UPI00398C0533
MSLLSRLLGLGRTTSSRPTKAVDLVEAPVERFPAPRTLGLDLTTAASKPWSASRLYGLFKQANRFPSESSLRDARHARHCLSRFWLSAPIDELELLYASTVGEAQRLLLSGPLPSQDLTNDEQTWRQTLLGQLTGRADCPERVNLMLALMPYFAPATLRLAEAAQRLPTWLLHDYALYCEPELADQLRQPAGLLEPGFRTSLVAPPLATSQPEVVDTPGSGFRDGTSLTDLAPQLSELRGEANNLFQDAEYYTRMQGLINLHRLDPADAEVIAELANLRRHLGQFWLDVRPELLGSLYEGPLGTLTRQLIQSGFGEAPLSSADRKLRSQLAPLAEDLSKPGAHNILLATLPFFPPGEVNLAGGQEYLAPWMQRLLAELSGGIPAI